MHSFSRAVAARLLLAVAFLVGSLTYSGVLFRHIALDTSLVVDASDQVLQDDSVQDTVGGWVAAAVYDQFLQRDPAARQVVVALQSFGIDVRSDADQIADRLVATPTFRAVFTNSIGAMHRYTLVDRSGPPPTIDLSPIVPTVREIAISVRANYEALPDVPMDLRVSVPRSAVPDATWGNRTITVDLLRTAATIAVLGMIGALVLHPNRPKALRRIGRFFIGLGIGQIVVVLSLPFVFRLLPDEAEDLANAVLGELRARLLAPAAIVVALGIGLWIAGRQWRRALGRRTSDEGRRAFTDGPSRFGTSQHGGRAQPGPTIVHTANAAPARPRPAATGPTGAYERGDLRPTGPRSLAGPVTAATVFAATTPLVPPRPAPSAPTSTPPTSTSPISTGGTTAATPWIAAPAGADPTSVLPVAPGPAPADAPGPRRSVFADVDPVDATNGADGADEAYDPFEWLSTLADIDADPEAPPER